MEAPRRSFAPVSARPNGDAVELPDWMMALMEDAAEPDPELEPAEGRRDHVLSRTARPSPERAVALARRSTPIVERLAPVVRRFQAPRRIWARRAAIAGILVGSCAVLVSGIVLTGGVGIAEEAASTRPGTVVAKSVGGVAVLGSFSPVPVTPATVPASDQPSSSSSTSPSEYETPPSAEPSESASPVPSPSPSPSSEPSDPPVDPPTDPPTDPPPGPSVDLPELPVDPFGSGFPF